MLIKFKEKVQIIEIGCYPNPYLKFKANKDYWLTKNIVTINAPLDLLSKLGPHIGKEIYIEANIMNHSDSPSSFSNYRGGELLLIKLENNHTYEMKIVESVL